MTPYVPNLTADGRIVDIDEMAAYLADSAIRNKDSMRANGEDSMRVIVGDVLTSDTATGYDARHLESDVARLVWGHPDGDGNVAIFGDDDGILDPMRLKRARKAEPLARYVRDRLVEYRDGEAATAWRRNHL
jgi:hypothetical protein